MSSPTSSMLLPNVYQLGYNLGSSLKYLMTTKEQGPSLSEISQFLLQFPVTYKNWWFHLVSSDPIHVAVETTLLASVIYMVIISRNKDYRSFHRERLSTREQEELLREWKEEGRANLAPLEMKPQRPPVVHSVHGRVMEIVIMDTDGDTDTGGSTHHKITLKSATGATTTTAAAAAATSTMTNTNNNKRKEDANTTNNNNCHSHSHSNNSSTSTNSSTNNSNPNATATPSSSPKSNIQTRQVLNFATHDFLGMSCNQKVKDASRAALLKYGCGSCGPRGFYGTIDVHLDLEAKMAAFAQTEGAIMYSDGASTVSSTVAAFSKRGDLLVVDDGVYEPLVTGVTLSRANVEWFRHNDMKDLRRVLEKVKKMDKALGRKPSDQRRFIVVEGLYKNSGTICPLDQLVALKHEFKYRLLVDESFSFGTLGTTGKGALELYNKRPMYDAELVTISLENALGSIGGVTVGNEEVVDHQRLSGAGYCFSASSPPFTASAAIESLTQLESSSTLVPNLQSNVASFHELLKQYIEHQHQKDASAPTVASDPTNTTTTVPDILVRTSDDRSPIVFWQVKTASQQTYEHVVTTLDTICQHALSQGIAMVSLQRRFPCSNTKSPAIRMIISAAHTKADLLHAVKVLRDAILQCAAAQKQ